jgi:hypothetical protein
MNIRLIVVVCLCSGKNNLEAKASRRHGGDRNRHSMKKLSMILLVIVRVFLPNPAFKMRDITL